MNRPIFDQEDTLKQGYQGTAARSKRLRAISGDFWIILAGGIILLLLIAVSQQITYLQPFRLIFGISYLLFVPGYCISAVLFPRSGDIDFIERLGLSLGTSIAWVPLLALILDSLPWGLRFYPIIAGEIVSIAVFCSLALWRRSRLSGEDVFAPALKFQPRLWWCRQPRSVRRVYEFIFVVTMFTALALAWTFLPPTPESFMTEFFMLGPDGLAEGFPQQAAVGEEVRVVLGVVNQEWVAHRYRVEIWAVDPWDGGRKQLLLKDGPYNLSRGSSRLWPVSWSMPWIGDDQSVEIILFIDSEDTPYRRLRLYLNINEP